MNRVVAEEQKKDDSTQRGFSSLHNFLMLLPHTHTHIHQIARLLDKSLEKILSLKVLKISTPNNESRLVLLSPARTTSLSGLTGISALIFFFPTFRSVVVPLEA